MLRRYRDYILTSHCPSIILPPSSRNANLNTRPQMPSDHIHHPSVADQNMTLDSE